MLEPEHPKILDSGVAIELSTLALPLTSNSTTSYDAIVPNNVLIACFLLPHESCKFY